MADTFQYLVGPSRSFPSAADGVSLTPSGTAWADSPWVEIIASAAADYYVRGLTVDAMNTTQADVEVDVGVGAAGSETVVTTFRLRIGGTLSLWGATGFWPHVILGDYISNGDRVSLRMRKKGADTNAWQFGLCLVEKPFTGNALTTMTPQKAWPAAADSVSAANDPFTPWVYSPWVALVASTAADSVLTGINIHEQGFPDWEVQVGIGAAGSEQVIGTYKGTDNGGGVGGAQDIYLALYNPLNAIPAGSRVAVRHRAGSSFVTCLMSATYHEKPL